MSVSENPKDYQRYKNSFKKFLSYLQHYSPDIVILSGTPWVKKDNLMTFDEDINKEICARNEIQANIAKSNNIEIINLYNLIKNNKKHFPYSDHVHFKTKKQQMQIAEYILTNNLDFIKSKKAFYKQIFSAENEYISNCKCKKITIFGFNINIVIK